MQGKKKNDVLFYASIISPSGTDDITSTLQTVLRSVYVGSFKYLFWMINSELLLLA